MPTWGELLKELQQLVKQKVPFPGGASPFDFFRRKYLASMAQRTGRNVILYATKWTQPGMDPSLTSITAEDVHGFMEVIHGLHGETLDLIIHSPGGSAEAAEALILYIRSKFSDVRVFVPHAAMSAATIMACGANRIVMGKHSFLGPIDPQILIPIGDGGATAVPAHAILEEFRQAQEECQDPAKIPAWLPILRQYRPALLRQCQIAQDLSRSVVGDWLKTFMFAKDADGPQKAAHIAKELSRHEVFKSHSRFISRDKARALGLTIDNLEDNQDVQDDVLSVYHATSHTFNATPAVKIIENHLGKAYLKVQQTVQLQIPQILPGPGTMHPFPPGLTPFPPGLPEQQPPGIESQ